MDTALQLHGLGEWMDLIYYPDANTMILRDHKRELEVANVRTEQEVMSFARECGFTGDKPTEIVRRDDMSRVLGTLGQCG